MSTETQYKQTKVKLDSWLKKVFETPYKIVGTIEWDPKFDEAYLFTPPNPSGSEYLIRKIVMGNTAEKELETIKLRILREYAKNPLISNINEDELTKKERDTLKEEYERYYQPLKDQAEIYEKRLNELQ